MPRWYEDSVLPSKGVEQDRHVRLHGQEWYGTQFFRKLSMPRTLSPLVLSPRLMTCHGYSCDDSEVKQLNIRPGPSALVGVVRIAGL